jgi:hypothetical protein
MINPYKPFPQQTQDGKALSQAVKQAHDQGLQVYETADMRMNVRTIDSQDDK